MTTPHQPHETDKGIYCGTCGQSMYAAGPDCNPSPSIDTSEVGVVIGSSHRAHSPAEELARRFHEAYERLAPSFGYETREASAKPWADVPEQNRRLMVAVCAELLSGAGSELVRAVVPTQQLNRALDLVGAVRDALRQFDHATWVARRD